MKQTIEILSASSALISGLTLFYAGLGVPPDEQSWKGQTPRELAIKRRQKIMVWVGLPFAGVAFLSQLIVILGF